MIGVASRSFAIATSMRRKGTRGVAVPSVPDVSIDAILRRQAGVISREQALAAGMTRAAVDHRLRTRRWRPLHPRVYLAGGHHPDDEVRVRAAVLWAGDGAVLSGVAAAWWHGLAEHVPATIGVTVSRRRFPRARPGLLVRRRDLRPEDRAELRGLPVTTLPLTALEAAVEWGAAGGRLLDRALQGGVRFPAVYEAYCRNLGSHGSATAGRLLGAAADRSASQAQRLLVAMLCRSGSTGWHRGFPAAGYRIDVAFPAARVAVEVDGWAWPMDVEATDADQRRRQRLARHGWTVLHYTWHDLTGRPHVVLADIAREVALGMATAG